MISEHEYVELGGVKCPHCESYDISGGAIDIDSGWATQEVDCLSCGAMWSDVYSLVKYVDLDTTSRCYTPRYNSIRT